MKKYHLIAFCIWMLLLSSCTSEMNEVSISIQIDRPVKSKGGIISDSIAAFIFYHENANDTMSFSNVIVTRSDLNRSDSLDVPYANGNEYRQTFGMYDVDNRKIDYDKNASSIPQPEILDLPNSGSFLQIPMDLEINQLVVSNNLEDGYNYFMDVKKARERIIRIIDSTKFTVMDFEVFFDRKKTKVELATPREEINNEESINQKNLISDKANSSEKSKVKSQSTPREAVYNVNLACQNWSNRVTWKRLPNAEKIVISVREKNSNPKAYNKNFEVFAGGDVFTIPPGRGIDATFIYNIELRAFDRDGNEMKLINNRISGVNIDCNN